jgi:hypothetical protein
MHLQLMCPLAAALTVWCRSARRRSRPTNVPHWWPARRRTCSAFTLSVRSSSTMPSYRHACGRDMSACVSGLLLTSPRCVAVQLARASAEQDSAERRRRVAMESSRLGSFAIQRVGAVLQEVSHAVRLAFPSHADSSRHHHSSGRTAPHFGTFQIVSASCSA